MKDVKFPYDNAGWDAYRAFHTHCGRAEDAFHASAGYNASPLVMFDTLEVICTDPSPSPERRGEYRSIGVELTTSKDITLWLPDGTAVAKAWLDDNGMQYLLHDYETKHVVALDGAYRPQAGTGLHAGIPKRFQQYARAYIPGPGMAPVSRSNIKVNQPYQKAGYTPEQMEHLHMLLTTGRAAMKLTDHAALNSGANVGADPDTMLKCKAWTDIPEALLPGLLRWGIGRCVREHAYLLSAEPK